MADIVSDGKSGKVVIKNIGLLLSGNIDHPILDADTIVVHDGFIQSIGKFSELDTSNAKTVIDVHQTCVAPGLIDTPIYGEGENSEQFKQNLQKGVLFPQRLGYPEELASMVVETITNSYMNAETIRVDGGIRMPPK